MIYKYVFEDSLGDQGQSVLIVNAFSEKQAMVKAVGRLIEMGRQDLIPMDKPIVSGGYGVVYSDVEPRYIKWPEPEDYESGYDSECGGY